MRLGAKLTQLRKEQGFSQEELADRLGVSRQAVGRWEAGTALPDAENLLGLGRIFSVSTDYLLKDELERKMDPPSALSPEDAAKKEENRRTAFAALTGLQFIALFWGVMGLWVYRSVLIALLAVTAQLCCIVGFEAAFRRYERTDPDKTEGRRWQRRFYRINVWAAAAMPSIVLVDFLCRFIPFPFSTLLLVPAYGAVWLAVCLAVWRLTREKE